MKVQICVLHNMVGIRKQLKSGGWKVQVAGNVISAWHPFVESEPEARQRLQDVGLLTAREIRIEFDPEGQGSDAQTVASS